LMPKVCGRIFNMHPNQMGWKNVRFDFENGRLAYSDRLGEKEILFGFGYKKPFKYIGTKSNIRSDASSNEYEAQASAAWINERTLAIYVYITDDVVNYLHLNAAFDDNRVTMLIKTMDVHYSRSGYMYGYN